MKKLIALLLLAAPAFAASWTVNTTAAQDTRATRELTYLNRATCAAVSLGPSCSQVAMRNAFCSQPNAIPKGTVPCTVNGKSSNDVRIFTTIGDYLDRSVIDSNDAIIKERQRAEDNAAWTAWLISASQAQKDAVCASAGFAAGCLP